MRAASRADLQTMTKKRGEHLSFGDLPIGRKFAAVLASILLLFVGSTALSIYQSVQQDRILSHMIDEVLVTERALERWSNNVTAGVQRPAGGAGDCPPGFECRPTGPLPPR